MLQMLKIYNVLYYYKMQYLMESIDQSDRKMTNHG